MKCSTSLLTFKAVVAMDLYHIGKKGTYVCSRVYAHYFRERLNQMRWQLTPLTQVGVAQQLEDFIQHKPLPRNSLVTKHLIHFIQHKPLPRDSLVTKHLIHY